MAKIVKTGKQLAAEKTAAAKTAAAKTAAAKKLAAAKLATAAKKLPTGSRLALAADGSEETGTDPELTSATAEKVKFAEALAALYRERKNSGLKLSDAENAAFVAALNVLDLERDASGITLSYSGNQAFAAVLEDLDLQRKECGIDLSNEQLYFIVQLVQSSADLIVIPLDPVEDPPADTEPVDPQ